MKRSTPEVVDGPAIQACNCFASPAPVPGFRGRIGNLAAKSAIVENAKVLERRDCPKSIRSYVSVQMMGDR